MALSQEQLQRLRSRYANRPEEQDRQARTRPSAIQQAAPEQNESFLGDLGTSLQVGVQKLPGTIASLGDTGYATGPGALSMTIDTLRGAEEPSAATRFFQSRPLSRAATALGEMTGFTPGEWAEENRQEYSPQMQEDLQAAAQAREQAEQLRQEGDWLGAVGTAAGGYLRNPRAIVAPLVESTPEMVSTGLAGRAISAGAWLVRNVAGQLVRRVSPLTAAAGVEGAMIAGQTMNELSENVGDDPEQNLRNAMASLGAGVGGGLIGYGGGRLAGRLGIADPEAVIAGQRVDRPGASGFAGRIAAGAVSEGLFQEMPQETLQTIASNWAEGEPLLANVPASIVEGTLIGGAMGGTFNIRRARPADLTKRTRRNQSREFPETPDEPTGPQSFEVIDREVGDLMRYHRRLATVARESTDPDLQRQALGRMETTMREMDRRGIPREVVDLELAKGRYTDLLLQEENLKRKYNQTMQTQPGQAQQYLAKLQRVTQQKQALEGQYEKPDLISPDYAITRWLRTNKANDGLFRTRSGETTNELKPTSLRKLNEFRETDVNKLLQQTIKEQENAINGAQTSKWLPLMEAALIEQGMTESEIAEARETRWSPEAQAEMDADSQIQTAREVWEASPDAPVSEAEAFDGENPLAEGEPVQRASATPTDLTQRRGRMADVAAEVEQGEAMDPADRDPNYTRMADLAAEVEQGEATDPAQEAPRPMTVAEAAGQSDGTRIALEAIQQAVADAEAGEAGDSIASRAAEIYNRRRGIKSGRQQLDKLVKKIADRMGWQAEPEQAPAADPVQVELANRELARIAERLAVTPEELQQQIDEMASRPARSRNWATFGQYDQRVQDLYRTQQELAGGPRRRRGNRMTAPAFIDRLLGDMQAEPAQAPAPTQTQTETETQTQTAPEQETAGEPTGEPERDFREETFDTTEERDVTPAQAMNEGGTLRIVGSAGSGQVSMSLTEEDQRTLRTMQRELEAGRMTQEQFDAGVAALQQATQTVGEAAVPEPLPQQATRSSNQLTEDEIAFVAPIYDRYADDWAPSFDDLLQNEPDLALELLDQLDQIENNEGLTVAEESNARTDAVDAAALLYLERNPEEPATDYYANPELLLPDATLLMGDLDENIRQAKEAESKADQRRLERVRKRLNKAIQNLRNAAQDTNPSDELIAEASSAIEKVRSEVVLPDYPGRQQVFAEMTDEIESNAQEYGRYTTRQSGHQLLDLVNGLDRREQEDLNYPANEFLERIRPLVEERMPWAIPLLDGLVEHPRVATLRMTVADAYRVSDMAYGLFNPQSSTVWLNYDHYITAGFSAKMGVSDPETGDPLNQFMETTLHELVHAVTLELANGLPANDPSLVELRNIQNALFTALNDEFKRPSNPQMSEHVRRMFGLMMDSERLGSINRGQAEVLTYALTDPQVREYLKGLGEDGRALPAAQQRSMFERIIDWIKGLLGMQTNDDTVRTLYDRVNTNFIDLAVRDAEMVWEDFADPNTEMRSLQMAKRRLEGIEFMAMLDEVDPDLQDMVARMQAIMEEGSKFNVQRISALQEGDEEAAQRAGTQADRMFRDAILVSQAFRERRNANRMGSISPTPSAFSRKQAKKREQVRRATSANQQVIDEIVTSMPGKVSDAWQDMKSRIRNFGMLSMFTSDFVDYTARWIPQVRKYYDTIRFRVSERNQVHTMLQNTVGPVASWSHEKRRKLNKFLARSTYEGKWGFKPSWIPDAQVDPAMKRAFDALPKDAQEVAKDMFKQAYNMHRELQDELRKDIERVFNESLERATKPKTKDRIEAQRDKALADHDARQADFRNAYLPLKRWGNWAVVYKSQAYRQAEQRKAPQRELDEMKRDERHYMVSFVDSQYQALQLQREWEEELGVPIDAPFPRMRYEESNEIVPFDLLQRLKRDINAEDGKASERIARALDRVYIEALSESSVRKSELRRIGVKGFDEDMVRAFVQHGQGVASLTSAIRINWQTREQLAQMKLEAQRTTDKRPKAMAALNEVLARHATHLEPESDWQQPFMAATSIWMLLTSPAYYIQNSTQPFMLTLPVLSARFGANRSFAYMTKAYKDIGKHFAETRRKHEGILLDSEMLEDTGERRMIEDLQNLNLLDIGIAADLGSLQDARTRTMRVIGGAHRRMLGAVRSLEVFNRGVTALAAYRLRYEQEIQAGKSAEESRRAAHSYAIEQVQTTQGDYSGHNAPRLIRMLPAGRILTQFRKFQLIQIGLLTRTVHQMFKGATTEEKAVGWRQMAYILGVHGAIGGLAGLPAANIILPAIAMAFEWDDEEPGGWEQRARLAIDDKAQADLILRGLPAWAGIDASNRLGMGLTFSILPFTDVDLSRDGMLVTAGSLMGPSVGLGAQFAQGLGKIKDGDVIGGVADLTPSLTKNLLKSFQYATDGVETRTGVDAITPEELDGFDLMTQALGWPSKTITDRYNMYGMLLDTEQWFNTKTSKIKQAYADAYAAGDHAIMAEARDEWRRLQEKRVQYGVGKRQPISNLLKAPRERREAERGMVGGVPTDRGNRRFVQQLFE